MNRKFKRSPKRRDVVIKGRPRIARRLGFFAKVRLAMAFKRRRLTVKSRSAILASLRRQRIKGVSRKPRKS